MRRQIELSQQERDDLEWLVSYLRDRTSREGGYIPSRAFSTVTSLDEIIIRYDDAGNNESG